MKILSRTQLKKKAWKLMSEWVRRKNSDWRGYCTCVTCNKTMQWKELHAGHFKHKDCLDYDERNINPQCAGCNTYRHGNLTKYTLWMLDNHGREVVDEIEKLSYQDRHFGMVELREIIEDLKAKIKNL